MRIHTLTALLVAGLLAAVQPGRAADDPMATAAASRTRGADYLISVQREDGSWGKYSQPAIAALCVMALHDAPATDTTARDAAIDRGMDYVLEYLDEGGAIRKEQRMYVVYKSSGYPVYTTSIALLAMAELNRPEYIPVMKAARAYLKDVQLGDPDARDRGGWGYDRGKRPDLSNTNWAAEALHATEFLDREPYAADESAAETTEAMRRKLDSFLGQLQVMPPPPANLEMEGDPAAGPDEGGFRYRVDSKLIATGSMTYAGLKSMLYARVDRSDRRVQGALNFIRHHYDLDSNPGEGVGGLYYYLLTMTKALDAVGMDRLQLADERSVNWRHDMIAKFAGMQAADGSWTNKDGRYFEAVPELASAYALIALRIAATPRWQPAD